MPVMRKRLHRQVRKHVKKLHGFVGHVWYPPFIAVLAALDNFILIIPTDGILISSSLLTPRRWFIFALNIAIGSTLGAVALAALVEQQGLPWILKFYPGLDKGASWLWALGFFDKYGLAFVFVVALGPLVQQPAVIMAGLANTPLFNLAAVIFLGRLLKFLFMAYIGSHTPRLLGRLRGLKGELEQVGVEIK
jgi:membrane protein YqaA with SNARE-associated domain